MTILLFRHCYIIYYYIFILGCYLNPTISPELIASLGWSISQPSQKLFLPHNNLVCPCLYILHFKIIWLTNRKHLLTVLCMGCWSSLHCMKWRYHRSDTKPKVVSCMDLICLSMPFMVPATTKHPAKGYFYFCTPNTLTCTGSEDHTDADIDAVNVSGKIADVGNKVGSWVTRRGCSASSVM